jgi:hypothetical protein
MSGTAEFETTIRVEVRWFLPGDVGDGLVPSRKPDKRRVDSYHLGSLTEGSAWKRRGRRGLFEWKRRTGSPLPITLESVGGVAERWVKLRTRRQPELAGPWIEVDKQIWQTGDWQVCRLMVDGLRSWTVALQAGESFPDLASTPKLKGWWPLLRAGAISASYPAWLIAHHPDVLEDQSQYAASAAG